MKQEQGYLLKNRWTVTGFQVMPVKSIILSPDEKRSEQQEGLKIEIEQGNNVGEFIQIVPVASYLSWGTRFAAE